MPDRDSLLQPSPLPPGESTTSTAADPLYCRCNPPHELVVSSADEGTNCYVHADDRVPCDPAPEPAQPSQEQLRTFLTGVEGHAQAWQAYCLQAFGPDYRPSWETEHSVANERTVYRWLRELAGLPKQEKPE